jgi:hypothetical protein
MPTSRASAGPIESAINNVEAIHVRITIILLAVAAA